MGRKVKYTSWMQNGPNPNIGEFDSPNGTIDNGGGSPPASTPVTVPTTGSDYSGWNWEQTLVGVLGLTLPDRNEVTNQRWTAINFNSGGGSGLLRIFAATWRSVDAVGPHKDIFVYLNPSLLQPGGIWDNFYHTPAQAILDATGGNYTGIQLDPRTFATDAAEVQGVITFYQNVTTTFQNLSDAVQGDASAFKGQAGGAFAQLMDNLHTAADSVATQMTTPANYADMIANAGTQVGSFITSLWNAMVAWTSMLDFQPLGAIYQALEDGGVIAADGDGNYQLANPSSTDSSFGDLTSADAWLAIEAAAKQLWLQSITSALDPMAQTALKALVTKFMNVASGDQPLSPPTLPQITAGGANLNSLSNLNNNPNLDGLNSFLSGLGSLGALNSLGDLGALNSLGGLGALNSLGGLGALNSLGDLGGLGALNSLGDLGSIGGLGGLNSPGGLGGLGGLNSPGSLGGLGGLNSPGSLGGLGNLGDGANLNLGSGGGPISPAVDTSLGGPGGLASLGGLNSPGGVSTLLGGQGGTTGSTPQLGALQTALADTGKTQSDLQQALALAPPTGPLNSALTTALANNSKARNALQAALAGSEPAATALQTALASNGQSESALRKALALAPSKGPLHNALESALGDSKKTQAALNQTLASGAIPGTSSIHQALNSDNAISGALHKALLSSQVPSRGPLHTALTNALGESGQVKSALDHALAGGATPSMPALNQALKSNTALQADLRNALGQVPAHGALHNELTAALANSKNVGSQIHQAMAQAGVASEPAPGTLSDLGNPAGALTGPYSSLGKQGLTVGLGGAGGGGGLSGLGGGGGVGGAVGGGLGGGLGGGAGGGVGLGAGHGGAATNVATTTGLGSGGSGGSGGSSSNGSGGASAASGASSSGSSGVPFFPPMAGGGGMGMGGQQQQQERERTTWLAEDEDVWGTEPMVGPAVIGRDFFAEDDEADDFDEAVIALPAREDPRIKAL